jgi:predicted acetyltransferase
MAHLPRRELVESGVAIDIRPVAPDELVAWSEAMAHAHGETGADATAKAAFRQAHYRPSDADRILGAYDGSRIVGTYRSFPTTLTLPGDGQIPVAAVTNVGVRPTHRRRGILDELTAVDLRGARERGETAAILIASEYRIYGRYGYGPATEHVTWTFDRARSAFESPVPAGGTLEVVSPAEAFAILPAIFERHRAAQPGEIDRIAYWWEVDLGLTTFPGRPTWVGWVVIHRGADGAPDGYVRYHVEDRWDGRAPASKLTVNELLAPDPVVEAALWRYVLDVDLMATIEARDRRVDEPVIWRLADARAATRSHQADFLWLRPLDVSGLLTSRRYAAQGRVIIEVIDPAGLAERRVSLEGGPDGASCRPSRAGAGLRVPAATLGSAILGGVPLGRLAEAGRLDVLDARALATADPMLRWPTAPWCTSWF